MLCEMYLRLEFEGQNLEKELNVLNGLQVYRSSRAPTTKHYNDVLVLFLSGLRKTRNVRSQFNKSILQSQVFIADTFWTFPSVRLIEVCENCAMFVNDQRLLCTVIKFHVFQEAIQSPGSLPFITNFNLFVNSKTLTDYSTYFKDVIQYPRLL